MTGKPIRKRRRRKEARPHEIVAAAMEAFTEQGFAGAKIENIAQRAGVAKGTVYLYFKSKEELFEAAVRQNISPTLAQLDDLATSFPGSASDLLARVIEQFYREVIEKERKRAILRVLIGEGARFPHLAAFYHQEIIVRARRLLRKIVRRGIQSGEFRRTPILRAPEVIMGPAIMAAIWKLTFDSAAPLNLPQFVKAHLDLVLHGLRTRD